MPRKAEPGVRQDPKRGTWLYVADAPGVDGRRRQVKKRGFETMEEANVAVRAFRRAVHDREVVAPDAHTVVGFARAWITALPAEGLEPATVKHYSECLNRLLPAIGTIRLQSLTALELDAAYSALLERGRAARTVRASHVAIVKMLKEAVRLGKVGRNVAVDARPPRAKAARAKQFTVWTYAETVRFLDAISDDFHHAAYAIAAHTGLRRGEVVALRWESVDLDVGAIGVERSVGKGLEGILTDKRPKSDAGRRVVEIDDELVALLRAHRKAQAERRLALGTGWSDNGLVFPEVDGSPIHPDRLSKRWSDLVKRHAAGLGVARIRFHGLRHSHATALLAAGGRPDVVSERLGHSSVAFTLSTYAHRENGDQRAVLGLLRGRSVSVASRTY